MLGLELCGGLLCIGERAVLALDGKLRARSVGDSYLGQGIEPGDLVERGRFRIVMYLLIASIS